MSDWTPDTDDIRTSYVLAEYGDDSRAGRPPLSYKHYGDQFDRWLAQHDAEVEAVAMARAANIVNDVRKEWYLDDFTPGQVAGWIRDRLDEEAIRLAKGES